MWCVVLIHALIHGSDVSDPYPIMIRYLLLFIIIYFIISYQGPYIILVHIIV